MKKIYCFISALLFFSACKEVYTPAFTSPATGYLVVEGFINSTGPTSVTLSRSLKLSDSAAIEYEHNAIVTIESENNESFPVNETGNGVYTSEPLGLNNAEKYRMRIKTAEGQEYLSDFTALRYTPPIDSISWKIENGGLQLYVNTHDPQNNTNYYKWSYAETWEFHSAFISSLEYVQDPLTLMIQGVQYRDPNPDLAIYKCWRTEYSTQVLIGSTEKLSTDKIYLPLHYIEPQSEKLSVLYSIELKQYALSHDAYIFNQDIKKNTEQLGSIFDPQPSQLNSNIHCISNPAELAVGYIEVSQEQVMRLFISNDELNHWGYSSGCKEIIIDNDKDSLNRYGYGYIPTTVVSSAGPRVLKIAAADPYCVDCTLRGTNVKPSFWP